MAFGAASPTPQTGAADTVTAESRVVACDGSDGPLGHPRVWLRIDASQIVCPYCSRMFVLRQDAGDDYGH